MYDVSLFEDVGNGDWPAVTIYANHVDIGSNGRFLPPILPHFLMPNNAVFARPCVGGADVQHIAKRRPSREVHVRFINDEADAILKPEALQQLLADGMFTRPLKILQIVGMVNITRMVGIFVINLYGKMKHGGGIKNG